MLGVGSGFLTSLAAVGFPPAVLAQFGMLAAAGGTIGSIIGKRITATELPQMVAGRWFSSSSSHARPIDLMTALTALHSVVGLAAVLTSIGSVLADVGHASMLHVRTPHALPYQLFIHSWFS